MITTPYTPATVRKYNSFELKFWDSCDHFFPLNKSNPTPRRFWEFGGKLNHPEPSYKRAFRVIPMVVSCLGTMKLQEKVLNHLPRALWGSYLGTLLVLRFYNRDLRICSTNATEKHTEIPANPTVKSQNKRAPRHKVQSGLDR